MTAKHTAGPWEKSQPKENGDITISGGFQRGKHGGMVGDLIATLTCGLSTRQAANADLIAAAPDLLAAAQAALRFIDSLAMPTGGWPIETRAYLNDAAPKLRAAIAGAKGGGQ